MALRHVSNRICPTPLKSPSRNCGGLFIRTNSYRISNLFEGVFGATSFIAQTCAPFGDFKCHEFIFNGLHRFFYSTYKARL